ncbi:MAG: hypothetical protein MN733_02710 [Nitrososphaera sp.]|nr:hypothetical protein [Nitrososphaera sp.]
MKVVLFCGGLGTRLREYSDTIPKPLVNIGYRPIIWHLMKYYAYHGHKDFILCLGYRGDLIKDFFLTYNECVSNDFVLSNGGKQIELLASDINDWRITFAETGLNSNIGQRLMAVRRYVETEDVFLANYSDGVTDLRFNDYLDHCLKKNCVASFLSVRPSQSFHTVSYDDVGNVLAINPVKKSDMWVNGGFFVLKRNIFDYMEEGDELVEAPFQRLIAEKQLYTHKYTGYWAAMDTFKDKTTFDRLYEQGNMPWAMSK